MVRSLFLVCLASALALAFGCGKRSPERGSVASASPTRRVPVDQIIPGELAEGSEAAFGLPLPRGMRVKARFPDAVYSEGRLPFESLSNYVRERVKAERVDTAPTRTVFLAAVPAGEPQRRLRVEVGLRGGIAELVVRDQTPAPLEPGLSEAERWRRAGMSPDGGVEPSQDE
jgi:hypothetical protein